MNKTKRRQMSPFNLFKISKKINKYIGDNRKSNMA